MQPTFADAPDLALKAYAEAGFHVEPDVLAHGLCDRLVEIANEFPARKQGDFRTVLQPHRREDAFLQALRHAGVTRILRLILGAEIAGIQTQFFYCQPGTPGFQPHQDNRYVNAPRGTFASAWVALTDVSPQNGGLILYPGSHKEPLLDVEEVAFEETPLQDANAMRLRCVIPVKYKPLDLYLKKGTAAFFDGHTVHASHPNTSNGPRYALLMTYVRRGVSFTPGKYAQRDSVSID